MPRGALVGPNGGLIIGAGGAAIVRADGCPCYVRLRKCVDDSLTSLWVNAADVPEGMTVLLSGGICHYLSEITSACTKTTASGTWYASCAACLEASVTCEGMGKKPDSVTFTAVGVNGGFCYDYLTLPGNNHVIEKSQGSADGSWTVPTFGVDGAWGVKSGAPGVPANEDPIGGFPLLLRSYVGPFDPEPPVDEAWPENSEDCHATEETLALIEQGTGYIEPGPGGSGAQAITIWDTDPVTPPAPGFPKGWSGYYVWRCNLRCRTGADDPRGVTYVETNQICFAPFNTAAACGGVIVVTHNY